MSMRKVSFFTSAVLCLQLTTFGYEVAEVKSVLKRRLGQDQGVAAVGVISKDSKQMFFHGSANGDTIFELCSVTKVFTALLLADMTVKNELDLYDPVNKLLGERAVTSKDLRLFHLATHTSGLPRSPADFTMKYSEQQLFEFLSNYSSPITAGTKFKYSNLGFGLLGHALALHSDTSYEQLVRDRICTPLQMKDTRIRMSPAQSRRHADGHSSTGQKIPTRELPVVYFGAGALRTTMNDMLKFLKANMAPKQSKLEQAINITHKPYLPSAIPDTRTGLAWNITPTGLSTVVWHEGQIQSHYAFIGVDRKQGIGTVILSGSGIPLTDIGIHILDSRQSISQSEVPPQGEFNAADLSLESFVGQYKVKANYVITVFVEDERLFSQASGMPKLEIVPISETQFNVKGFNIKMTFIKDQAGEITSLIVHQAGTEVKAQKQMQEPGM